MPRSNAHHRIKQRKPKTRRHVKWYYVNEKGEPSRRGSGRISCRNTGKDYRQSIEQRMKALVKKITAIATTT